MLEKYTESEVLLQKKPLNGMLLLAKALPTYLDLARTHSYTESWMLM